MPLSKKRGVDDVVLLSLPPLDPCGPNTLISLLPPPSSPRIDHTGTIAAIALI